MGLSGDPAGEERRPKQGTWRPDTLAVLLLVYLAGPLLMLVELLHPVAAALLLLAFLLAAKALRFELPRQSAEPTPRPRWRTCLTAGVLLAVVLSWILASGIGGFAYCRFDYIKHWVMFSALYQDHLPVQVIDPRDQSQQLLHYYFAYYITPVRLTQVLERLWSALDLDVVLVAYYSLAALGALRLLARLAEVPPLALLGLVILTGGLDAAGLAAFGIEPVHEFTLFDRIPIIINFEWWGVPLAPQAFTVQLYWAPQHFFGALIGLPLLLAALRGSGGILPAALRAAFVLIAAALWSPYVAVGLGALAAVELLLQRRELWSVATGGGWRAAMAEQWRPALALLVFALPTGLYLMASRALEPPRLMLAEVPVGDWLLTYVLNHLPFLAAAAATFWLARQKGSRPSPWRSCAQTLALGLLLEALLLSLSHGHYNDWAMRTTLPVLLWMTLPLCRLLAGDIGVALKVPLFLAVGLSSASALMEIALSLEIGGPCPPYDAFGFADLEAIADQYLADRQSLFYRWLSP